MRLPFIFLSLSLTLPPARAAEVFEPPLLTATDARTFTFSVPAPRGLITDRDGALLADSEVAHYLAVEFPRSPDTPFSQVYSTVLAAREAAEKYLGVPVPVPASEAVQNHFTHRRWLPMRLSQTPLRGEPKSLQDGSGLILEPVYLRRYPEGETAAHVIGYVGREDPLPTGEIREKERLFEEYVGRAGIEKQFEMLLRGTPGLINYIFDGSGALVQKSVIRAPVPGHTIVTTLNLPMQKAAEESLSEKVERGAIVIADAFMGDLYVLATQPRFDPNMFVPSISTSAYRKLEADPNAPLFDRAVSAAYPPGSVFKPIVSCGLLGGGYVTPATYYNGVPEFEIAGRIFKNWNPKPEGMLDVVGALKRSCNTWFYQAALDTGAAPILDAAKIFGYGSPVDLGLGGEASGNLPAGPFLSPHALVNTSIGQGEVLASPLQVTMATAALANQSRLPEPGIIFQIQDTNNRVVRAVERAPVRLIPFDGTTLSLVRAGMDAVVNDGRGTAQAAQVPGVRIAGKTGTAQWTQKNGLPRWLGWFTGFTFVENPQLAFTAVYEGNPGVEVSSGKVAAPMVASVIGKIYGNPNAFSMPVPVALDPPFYAAAEPLVAPAAPPGYNYGDLPPPPPGRGGRGRLRPPPSSADDKEPSLIRRLFGR